MYLLNFITFCNMFSLNAVQVIIFNKVKHKSVHGLKLSWQLYEMKYF